MVLAVLEYDNSFSNGRIPKITVFLAKNVRCDLLSPGGLMKYLKNIEIVHLTCFDIPSFFVFFIQ